MQSLNKVMLIGNLGRDPETRSFANGGGVTSLTVATSEKWKDKNTGDLKEKTEWHRVEVFAEPAQKFAANLRKGEPVYVEGQLETRKWQDQSGNDRFSTEVAVRPYTGRLTGLGSPSRGSTGEGRVGTQGAASTPQRPADGGFGTQAAPSVEDDEIPF